MSGYHGNCRNAYILLVYIHLPDKVDALSSSNPTDRADTSARSSKRLDQVIIIDKKAKMQHYLGLLMQCLLRPLHLCAHKDLLIIQKKHLLEYIEVNNTHALLAPL